MSERPCPVAGCKTLAPGGRLMCAKHWGRVPEHARQRLYRETRSRVESGVGIREARERARAEAAGYLERAR